MDPVLVTGATGRVGRIVVDQLLDAGVPVRALTRRPDAAGLPAAVEVVAGDLTVPESLDAGLHGVSAVFLVWTAHRIFFGPVRETLSRVRDVSTLELAYLLPLVALVLLFGIRPGAVTPVLTNGVIQITTRLAGG